MAVNLSSAWPYILPVAAVFTILCWVIAIPGLVAPLKIHLQRRDVPESTTDPHLNIRHKNRDAQPSKARSDSTERTRMTTTFDGNFLSNHNDRTSGKNSRKVEGESERTSTMKNLVLSKPGDEKVTDFEPSAGTHAHREGDVDGDDESDRTDVTSQSDLSIDMDEYYTYDFDDNPMDDDDDEDEDEDDDADFMDLRSKKEANNNLRTEELRSLQRLAELATLSNPELGFVNLITPNPDLDITIEVVTDDDDDDEDAAVIDNRLPGDERPPSRPRPPPPAPADDRGKNSGRRKGKGRKHNQNRNNHRGNGNHKPSRQLDNNNGNTSSYFDMTLFHLIRQTELLDRENGDSSNPGFGEWSAWSSCSSSCGGGKRERTRPCGSQCRTTEKQECNKHICSGSSITSESENDFDMSELPSTTRSNQGFVIDQGFTIDVVDEIADVIDNSDFDSCEEWMECRSEKLLSYLSRLDDLPSCPCEYPTNNAIVDPQHGREFHWMVQDPEATRLDIYKPTAARCILSLRSYHSTSLASQQCCYNADQRLITRGQGAGTPQLITAQISQELHHKIDILPWIICKGDWTKYNRVRQPNNGRECPDIPDLETFLSQVEEAGDF